MVGQDVANSPSARAEKQKTGSIYLPLQAALTIIYSCLCTKASVAMGKATNDNVRVMIRIRPFNKKEIAEVGGIPTCTLRVESDTLVSCIDPANEDNVATFPFDCIFWSMPADQVPAPIAFADQPEVYAQVGVPQLDSMFDGYNGCIFAYGQTSSGMSSGVWQLLSPCML